MGLSLFICCKDVIGITHHGVISLMLASMLLCD
ncbi:hypothetical protein BN440_3827 [Erwinia amylovora MR1]|nr:hypothetical protein BN440_3827 [Erwinia amylovora MR1]